MDKVVDLLGDEIGISRSIILHRGAYPADPGSANNNKTCGDCNHYRSIRYHSKSYRKCAVIEHRWTRGLGTDIKKSSLACRFFTE